MQRYAVLVSLLVCAMIAQAEPWRPFLGAGANLNTTNNSYIMYRGDHYTALDLPDHGGMSLQVEGGMTNSYYSVYLGYRSGSSTYDDGESFGLFNGLEAIKIKESDITSEHFAIGARVQPVLKFMPESLRPLLGLGVTYGKAKKETKWDDTYVTSLFPDTTYATESFDESLESEDAYGGILQFGLSYRPVKLPLQVYLMYEIHAYQARFEDTKFYSPTADQYEIRENGVKLGAIFHFGKLGGEE